MFLEGSFEGSKGVLGGLEFRGLGLGFKALLGFLSRDPLRLH